MKTTPNYLPFFGGKMMLRATLTVMTVVSIGLVTGGCQSTDLSKTYTGSTTMVIHAKSGQKQLLTNVFKVNEDCSSARPPALKIVSEPVHGSVSIVRSTTSTTYEPGHKLHKCNSRKISALAPIYVSNPGYVGEDRVRISGQVAGNPREFYDYFEFRVIVTK
ncbi:hypothetical protein [Phyllobacterium sp. SB3]|uniref:hypothetical protein n=1 Tax=Phyllobacterium sp. SB3 TaxID=3156073 RepID=UPI0032AEFC79